MTKNLHREFLERHGLLILILVPFLIFLVYLFSLQAKGELNSDFLAHIELSKLHQEIGSLVFPPLYFLSFELIGVLLPGENSEVFAAGLILCFVVILKLILIYRYLIAHHPKGFQVAAGLSLMLLLFFPFHLFVLDGENWYMGKYSPNVWHNSTILFVWPFCILLFKDAIHWLTHRDKKAFQKLLVWSLIILLSKPSFLLAFVPAFPLIDRIVKKKWNKASILYSVAFMIGIISLKFLIYDIPSTDLLKQTEEKVQVVVSPFSVFRFYSQAPLWEFVASFAFPLVVFILLGKELFTKFPVKFGVILTMVSMAIYFTFAETSYRFQHANFYWQIPISLSILYLVLADEVWNYYESIQGTQWNWKFLTILIVFIGHVFSGVNYLNHYLETKNYL